MQVTTRSRKQVEVHTEPIVIDIDDEVVAEDN